MRKPILKISKLLQQFTTFVLLHGIYAIGIGATSLVGMMIGKKFLPTPGRNSTWTNHTERKDDLLMY